MTGADVKPLLPVKVPVPSDIEIAQSVEPVHISKIADAVGLLPTEYDLYGIHKAKVKLNVRERLAGKPDGKYVVVAGITPTPLGEGKSTTTIGLCQALGAYLKKKVLTCVRQPSQGPTFGIKGGAAGGGYSQVRRRGAHRVGNFGDVDRLNALSDLNGNICRVAASHTQSVRLLFLVLVNTRTQGKRKFAAVMLRRLAKLGITKTDPQELTPEERRDFARLDIDPASITWRRVMDTNDRFLRAITVGKGGEERGQTRDTGFDITVSSEIMAVLALATDLSDMRERLGRMVIGNDTQGRPVTADDLGVGGALTVLMRDAIEPTLCRWGGGRGGCGARGAGGGAGVCAGVGGVESGVGVGVRACGCEYEAQAEGGGEGGVRREGRALQSVTCSRIGTKGATHVPPPAFTSFHLAAHLTHPIMNVTPTPPPTQPPRSGASAAVICAHHGLGGAGAVDLAEAVVAATAGPKPDFKFLYDVNISIKEKIETIAREMYHAAGVEYLPEAEAQIEKYTRMGFDKLPICMAKTQYSFSHDAAKKGAPSGFILPIRDVRASVGAGFLFPLVGSMMTMPGLPTRPCFYDIDIDPATGKIVGLS
eukprot:XP_001693688.1 10-formyltetrahydrofolate synthetase [Chlamydomonas reinhardtii]